MKVRRIAILLYDGVETLDVAGPADVFFSANELLGRQPAPYDIVVAGTRRGRIVAESGVCFHADTALSDRRLFDTIIIPGGKGVRVIPRRERPSSNFCALKRRRYGGSRRFAPASTRWRIRAYSMAGASRRTGAMRPTCSNAGRSCA